MKKRLVFGLTALALTLGAAGARSWQRQAAFEPGTGLLTPGHPATWCLVALVAVGALALLALAGWCVKGTQLTSYLRAFALPVSGLLAVYLLAGALLVAAGVLGLEEARQGLSTQTSRAVLAGCLIPGGLCVALVGWLGAQRREAEGRFAWSLLGPGVCGCVWLVAAYQGHTANPTTMDYAPYLLGAACAVCACYTMASFSFEKPQSFWCLWLCGAGLVLLATAVADSLMGGETMALLVCLGYGLYLAAQLTCLLCRLEAEPRLEPWEPPAEETQHEAEIEVTDHE